MPVEYTCWTEVDKTCVASVVSLALTRRSRNQTGKRSSLSAIHLSGGVAWRAATWREIQGRPRYQNHFSPRRQARQGRERQWPDQPYLTASQARKRPSGSTSSQYEMNWLRTSRQWRASSRSSCVRPNHFSHSGVSSLPQYSEFLSMTTMRPPGRTTRHISLTAASTSTACSSDSVA